MLPDMRRFAAILLAVFAVFATATIAPAADMSVVPQAAVAAKSLPFPRSERAASVWDSRACWSGCQSSCTWALAACVTHDAQGHCLSRADTCDRVCQTQCRPMGGPYLPGLANLD
ncbi:MAG: hypothetical protein OJF62_003593 [Pseudolabrys sp.]|jgi:hypothetical protein|nr:hypothetical protein [Pseudolabrys sp.]